MMTTDAITDAVSDAIAAVSAALPSQGTSIGVEGVRKTETGSRRVRGLIHSAVVTSGFSDPLGEISTASETKVKTVIFTKCGDGGWFDATPPRDGDTFKLDNGELYAVFSVEEKANAYYKVGIRKC